MKNKKQGLSILLAVFMCLSLVSISAVSAYNPISTNKNVNLAVANDNGARFNVVGNNQYNFFSSSQGTGQGLNALHITNSIGSPDGAVVNTQNSSGTFYLSDTGGRGWDDDGILMIAVNGSMASLANLSIHISSSGYQWKPVVTGSYPAYNNTTYNASTLSETFVASDFNSNTTGYNSTWKPCPTANYALYEGQNTSNTTEFHIIFVDLNAGIIGQGTQSQTDWTNHSADIHDNGMIKVSYSVSGLPSSSLLSFNDYAFCNSSNQGQGIRWTNSINTAGNNSASTSGWNVASWF
jgi:hypothetical protein